MSTVDAEKPPLRERPRGRRAAWGEPTASEPKWQARIAIIVAALLYLTLPAKYTLGPTWLFPALEGAVLIVLLLGIPTRLGQRWARGVAIGVIALIMLANNASLVLLIRHIIQSEKITGRELLYSSIAIWLTNVIVFALWYWELDRGGPDARRRLDHPEPDFLFPQMVTPGCSIAGWTPVFLDYLYVAFTNATAFSPTDTMPLTPWAKSLMLVQSAVSLATITLVAARAVNILS